ncbi:hypothetical protein BJV78DRAFT_930772 [Lactifluus subvellereus]|nr:hypothetical protein BJV78DRAFT_930772 [Lactifluus subvellereus]
MTSCTPSSCGGIAPALNPPGTTRRRMFSGCIYCLGPLQIENSSGYSRCARVTALRTAHRAAAVAPTPIDHSFQTSSRRRWAKQKGHPEKIVVSTRRGEERTIPTPPHERENPTGSPKDFASLQKGGEEYPFFFVSQLITAYCMRSLYVGRPELSKAFVGFLSQNETRRDDAGADSPVPVTSRVLEPPYAVIY